MGWDKYIPNEKESQYRAAHLKKNLQRYIKYINQTTGDENNAIGQTGSQV
jgi:hypothetical protein